MAQDDTEKQALVYVVGREFCEHIVPGQLLGDGFQVRLCDSRQALSQGMAEAVPDVVIMSVEFALGKERLLERLRREFVRLPVVILADEPDVETVVR